MLAGVPRVQHNGFVLMLRQRVFENPPRVVGAFLSSGGEQLLKELWRSAGRGAARVQQAELLPNQPGPDRHAELTFQCMRTTTTGQPLVIVTLPEPQRSHEAYYVGITMPADPALQHDLDAARERVRFFVLYKFGGPDRTRRTDLCEYRKEGELTYNIGAPATVEGFAAAIDERLAHPPARPVVVTRGVPPV
jgi:hypothetical protein